MLSNKISILLVSLVLVIGVIYAPVGYGQVTDLTGVIIGQQADVFGLVDIASDGHKLDISGVVNYVPPEGKVFEVWLYDGNYGASLYPWSVGMVKDDGTFDSKSTQVNAYTYTDLFITMEPKDDKDPKPDYSKQVGIYPLDVPYRQ